MYVKSLAAVCAVAFLMFALGACGSSRQVVKDQTAVPAVEKKEPATAGAQKKDATLSGTKGAPVATPVPAVVLKDIHFDFDRYLVGTEAGEILKQNSEWFKTNKGRLRIEGDCDERGTVEYNLALGQKRAEAAKKFLTTMGIDGARMDAISYGKEKPADQGHGEESWSKNRRDHFVPVP